MCCLSVIEKQDLVADGPDVKTCGHTCDNWCVFWVSICLSVYVCDHMQKLCDTSSCYKQQRKHEISCFAKMCCNCPVLYLKEEGFEVSFPSLRHRCNTDIKIQCVLTLEEWAWTHLLILPNLFQYALGCNAMSGHWISFNLYRYNQKHYIFK